MAEIPPPSPERVSVDESSDLIELFKLEATHTHEYTSQISTERDPTRGARKIKVEKRWYRGNSLGHGAFGDVWVEHDCNVPDAATAVRAVKEVSKGYMRRIRLDYRRELIALATLSKVRHIPQVDFRAACAQINVLL
jgi:serine/threonine protein kinase